MLTYELIPGGYRILRENGEVALFQDFDPRKLFVGGRGQAFDSAEDAIAHAEAFIAEQAQPAP